MADDNETPHQQVDPLALVGNAVDLALGVVALGIDAVKQVPDLAAGLPERAQREYESLLVRGSALRGSLGGLLAGRLLGPPIVEDEPAEVDPFDLLLIEDEDDDVVPEAPRTPLVVVTAAAPPAPEPTGALPLEGFDEMTIGTLRVSARQLAIPDLELLLTHERDHGRRDGVLSLLETRIAQLQQEQSAG
jgi:hypothetical protein